MKHDYKNLIQWVLITKSFPSLLGIDSEQRITENILLFPQVFSFLSKEYCQLIEIIINFSLLKREVKIIICIKLIS